MNFFEKPFCLIFVCLFHFSAGYSSTFTSPASKLIQMRIEAAIANSHAERSLKPQSFKGDNLVLHKFFELAQKELILKANKASELIKAELEILKRRFEEAMDCICDFIAVHEKNRVFIPNEVWIPFLDVCQVFEGQEKITFDDIGRLKEKSVTFWEIVNKENCASLFKDSRVHATFRTFAYIMNYEVITNPNVDFLREVAQKFNEQRQPFWTTRRKVCAAALLLGLGVAGTYHWDSLKTFFARPKPEIKPATSDLEPLSVVVKLAKKEGPIVEQKELKMIYINDQKYLPVILSSGEEVHCPMFLYRASGVLQEQYLRPNFKPVKNGALMMDCVEKKTFDALLKFMQYLPSTCTDLSVSFVVTSATRRHAIESIQFECTTFIGDEIKSENLGNILKAMKDLGFRELVVRAVARCYANLLVKNIISIAQYKTDINERHSSLRSFINCSYFALTKKFIDKFESFSLGDLFDSGYSGRIFFQGEHGVPTISGKHIKSLDGIEKMIDVEGSILELAVEGTSVEKIPSSFPELFKNIRILNLRRNQFTKFPEVLVKMKHLEELSIADNHIAEVPGWITQCPKLRKLNITKNKVTKLPKSLKNRLEIIADDVVSYE